MNSSGGVNFIDENPALTGMSRAETVMGQQTGNDLSSMQLSELMRTRDVEHAIDEAIRGQIAGQPQPGAPDAQSADLGSMSMGGQPQPAMQGQSMPRGTSTPAAPSLPAPYAAAGNLDIGRATPQPGGNAIVPIPNAVPGEGGTITPMGGAAPQALSTMSMASQPQSTAKVNAGLDRQALARKLAGIPGGGPAAMQFLDQDQAQQEKVQAAALERQDHAVTNYFKSIENGDTYSAKYWGKQAGMNVPDDVMHDADFQKFMGQASKWKEFYGSDLHGFQAFFQAATQLHGANDPDAFQKAYRANPPTEKPVKGGFDDKNAEIGYLMSHLHYTQDQAARAVGLSPDGSSGRGGAHSGGVFQFKHDLYLRQHPDDEEGAMAFANGEKKIGYKDAMDMAKGIVEVQLKNGGYDDEKPVLDRVRETAMKIMTGDDNAFGGGTGGQQQQTPGAAFGLAQEAYDAIAKGAAAGQDISAAVKQRYKEKTGQDLPEQGSQ